MTTLIIGGGLSGIALAERLQARGADYLLIEARGRFGGRILTEHHGAGHFDMGPAWFWSGQPRIAALIDRLGLQKFEQHAAGTLTFEDARGQVQRGQGFASMQGSWRLQGGLGRLTQTLADALPETRKRLNAQVASISQSHSGITAILTTGEALSANQVVLALPPRVASEIAFDPPLPAATLQAMQGIPTWMAGQAKAVAVYDTAFWRDAGLSGDAMSRMGPMAEIHDASPARGGPYALFGFIGVSAQARQDEQVLRRGLTEQLGRLFGPQAAAPIRLMIKDWAFDPHTATQADLLPLYAHPTYGLPRAMSDLWDNRLLFAGTEVGPEFGGYLEGALEAAENTVALLHQ